MEHLPCTHCRQLLGALRKHGAGDLAADGRTDRLSCLRDRNVGDPDGAVALSESDESRDQGGLRPADQGALYSGSQEYGGGNRARYLRPLEDRRAGIGRERGGDRHGPQDHLRGGYLRRDEQRRRHAGRRTYRSAYRVGEYRRRISRPCRKVPQHDDVPGIRGLRPGKRGLWAGRFGFRGLLENSSGLCWMPRSEKIIVGG